jgi:hypothetical protein
MSRLMRTGTATLWVDRTPPSKNHLGKSGSRGGWRTERALVKSWQGDLANLCLAEKVPRGCRFVAAEILLTFPRRAAKRDPENYRYVIGKALGDALQDAGVIDDDGPHRFAITGLRLIVEPQIARTTVVLRWRR